jgi:hypothetical protein
MCLSLNMRIMHDRGAAPIHTCETRYLTILSAFLTSLTETHSHNRPQKQDYRLGHYTYGPISKRRQLSESLADQSRSACRGQKLMA